MSKPQLIVKKNASLATLYLNQPEKRNAMSFAMWQALPGILAELEADQSVSALIVCGSGEKAFCAGADISEFPKVFADQSSTARYNSAVHAAQVALSGFTKPTLAAIQGVCVGGGCGIALCCDVRIAKEGASFGITPARLGIAYSFEDTKRLVDVVGPASAKDILFTGKLVDAQQALRIGLICELAQSDDFETAVANYAGRLTENSQYSIRAAKMIINAMTAGADQSDEAIRTRVTDSYSGEDFKEGYSAFNARRKPQFRWR